MLFKNSVKILFSNFNIVWKMMLYLILALFFWGIVIYLLATPIVEMIDTAGFFNRFVDLYAEFLTSLNLTSLFDSIAQLLDEVIIFIAENIAELWFYFTALGFVILFVIPMAVNLICMPTCTSLHLYMGSLARQSLSVSLKENFSKNFKVQLVYYITTLPINLIGICLLILSFELFNISWLVSMLAVFGIVIGFILFVSIKYTLFSSWIPMMVVTNYGVWKALRSSCKMVFKRFGRIFGNAIGIVLTILCLNIALGMFSFMVGLLVTVPISIVLVNVFGMTTVYEGQGMRYYVDIYNVITPKKKEDSDKLKDMLYIV